MGKNCVICGKPSGMYPLCREHLQMKAEGKVVKCEECGKWHLITQYCGCASKKQQQDEKLVEFVLGDNSKVEKANDYSQSND